MQLGNEKKLFTVSGVAEEAPEESSIKYSVLFSYDNEKFVFRERLLHSWFNIFNETYVLLKNNTSVASLQNKFPAMLKKQLGKTMDRKNLLCTCSL
jgi:putative ABC transport system permease protein